MASIEREVEATLARAETARKNYEPLISSADERNMYNEFTRNWDGYLNEVRTVLEHSRKNDNNVARDLNSREAGAAAQRCE